jgi:hypothetical protein
VRLPDHLRRALRERFDDPERQRIVLALLLQPAASTRGRLGHRWHLPPVSKGEPGGGLATQLRRKREG